MRRFIIGGCLIGMGLWCVCGGNDADFELIVINTLQSSESIRVDLGGDTRFLQIGDVTVFRSVSQGQHILSIEGTTCAGTVRDTLTVQEDITVRYNVSRNTDTGDCEVQSTVSRTRALSPINAP
jgi:hypothetical protein